MGKFAIFAAVVAVLIVIVIDAWLCIRTIAPPFLRMSALSLADIKARPHNVRFTPKANIRPSCTMNLRKSSARGR